MIAATAASRTASDNPGSRSRSGSLMSDSSFYLASSNGAFATVDPTLEQLLGRPPVGMREILAAALERSGVAAARA